MLVAIGAGGDLERSCEVINYEAPFGVGYMVAQLTWTIPSAQTSATSEITRLARETVETFVPSGIPPNPPADPLASSRKGRRALFLSKHLTVSCVDALEQSSL